MHVLAGTCLQPGYFCFIFAQGGKRRRLIHLHLHTNPKCSRCEVTMPIIVSPPGLILITKISPFLCYTILCLFCTFQKQHHMTSTKTFSGLLPLLWLFTGICWCTRWVVRSQSIKKHWALSLLTISSVEFGIVRSISDWRLRGALKGWMGQRWYQRADAVIWKKTKRKHTPFRNH